MTFAQKVIDFNKSLELKDKLPEGIEVMNPFMESETALEVSSRFYKKYYNDDRERKLVLGINPGRLGAGVTGVPFTDTKRLISDCDLTFDGKTTHEPSSVFVYEVINAFGSAKAFYDQIYINSVCPLGFVIVDDKGRKKNYNYYDDKRLEEAVTPFIVKTIKQQISFGCNTEEAYCFGTGKNYKFLAKLNKKEHFFDRIVPLEHPRYVMQYKAKHKIFYIDKYLNALM